MVANYQFFRRRCKNYGKNYGKTEDLGKIIALMKANPEITTSDLAEACGITVDGVDYQIKKLKEKNKVRRVGEKNGGHWEVLEEI